jgi:cbb3-type cytochrome c oxidase subunit III
MVHNRIFRHARRLAGVAGSMGLISTPALHAAEAGSSATETALVATGVLTILLIAITFLTLMIPEEEKKALAEGLKRMGRYLGSGPSERVPTFDHDFDGIHELDNRIPPWFTTLFLATVLFGGAYLLDYHVFRTSRLPGEEYREEMAAADLHRRVVMATEGQIDESQLVALADPAALNRGAENFKKYCVSCHGVHGQGVVGPNLTDDYWIHGGSVKNVFATIKLGVPAKGMISWGLVFTPKQIQELASYVLSLRGTNPPGAKTAEGQLYVEPAPSTLTVAPKDTAGTRKL